MLRRENIKIVKNNKFKTIVMTVSYILPLDEDNASKNALIMHVLSRGTKNYPTMQDINKKLAKMYSAKFGFKIDKLADSHKIEISIEFLNNKYTKNGENITVECIKLLNEILNEPYLENGLFKQEYFDREKEFIKDEINSLIDNKREYAVIKCEELTCREEPFSICKYGLKHKVDEITIESIMEYYINIFKKARVEVGICGDVEESISNDILENLEVESHNFIVENVNKQSDFVKEVCKMDVNQSKLSIGYKIENYDIEKDIFVGIVYDCILGETPSSRLFLNVREKASLAYYARSKFYKDKGMIIINTGIEAKNYDKALQIINEQIDSISKYGANNGELEVAKKYIVSGVNQIKDINIEIVRVYINNYILLGRELTLEDITLGVKQVTLGQIQEFARRVKQKAIYFIQGGN